MLITVRALDVDMTQREREELTQCKSIFRPLHIAVRRRDHTRNSHVRTDQRCDVLRLLSVELMFAERQI